ncbi:hypothetical protein HYN59_15825 [Flavobacterium album]|uniref:SMI1/KNR4 family protein n=1 Tax=Flavobacterium album TaxID=2175091 RepID=A0A2S1R1M8_9FLAO|nr:hypothetical protein [Flavobacterium album]AWH86486.1 hypothetical protein HYN59_15825 [Flavobacterium album]
MENDNESVFDRLIKESTSFGVAGDYLESSIKRVLLPTLSNGEFLPYERREQFQIPDEYLYYLSTVDIRTVKPNGQDLYIYGLMEALSLTVNYVDCDADPDEQPVFWLSVGHRSDRGNFFICCDKASELYGQVGEFYDSSPFRDIEDFYCIGTGFADFCENVLAGKVY